MINALYAVVAYSSSRSLGSGSAFVFVAAQACVWTSSQRVKRDICVSREEGVLDRENRTAVYCEDNNTNNNANNKKENNNKRWRASAYIFASVRGVSDPKRCPSSTTSDHRNCVVWLSTQKWEHASNLVGSNQPMHQQQDRLGWGWPSSFLGLHSAAAAIPQLTPVVATVFNFIISNLFMGAGDVFLLFARIRKQMFPCCHDFLFCRKRTTTFNLTASRTDVHLFESVV